MDKKMTVSSVPRTYAHTHFFDYISDFPGLPIGDSLEDMHKKNMRILREEFLHGKNFDESLVFK